MRRFEGAVAALGPGLAACSSGPTSDTAATTSGAGDICAPGDDLPTPLASLRDAQIVQHGTAAVEQAWSTVGTAVSAFRQDVGALADEVKSAC
ncbi:MAG: hypothetical protein JWP40_1972 [Blastococcus sp.]|jgi:hypothetical protein|nr:hypothetical protein [Blastococcus sp.]